MATNSTPIIFKITQAGKQAALVAGANSPGVQIKLTQVAIGYGRYTPTGNETALVGQVKRVSLVSGDVETLSNTLRFSANITMPAETGVYEIGLITDGGVLFAVAASPSRPLLTVQPDINFIASFGLSLKEVGSGNVTVATDPNGALALTIMENHLAAPDPHPQYLNINRFQFLVSTLIPYGYLHYSHSDINPKPLFDELMGIDTYWRLLKGVQIVGVDPNDSDISSPMVLVGDKGSVTKSQSGTPNSYPLRTSYIWERYNQDIKPVLYDGQHNYDGQATYQ